MSLSDKIRAGAVYTGPTREGRGYWTEAIEAACKIVDAEEPAKPQTQMKSKYAMKSEVVGE